MEYYAVSSERGSYHHPAHNVHTNPLDAYKPDATNNHLAPTDYSLHYNYFVQPPFSQQAYSQPIYSHSQPASQFVFPSPTPGPAPQVGHAAYPPEVPLHAPVPLSGYSSLISPAPFSSVHHPAAPAPQPSHADFQPYPTRGSETQPQNSSPPAFAPPADSATASVESSPLEYYSNAPRITFQTPSELLTELNVRDKNGSFGSRGPKTSVASPPATVETSSVVRQASRSNASNSSNTSGGAKKPQPETQRKAYFRAVAEAIGFTPTDPDTITSHDKKRNYLECVEQYVQWVHDQIRLVGYEPVPFDRVFMERASEARGMSSRSIRTVLVHMQDEIRELHGQMAEEEREFVNLQMQVSMQQASADAHLLRRHSIATLPETPSLQPFLQTSSPSSQPQMRY